MNKLPYSILQDLWFSFLSVQVRIYPLKLIITDLWALKFRSGAILFPNFFIPKHYLDPSALPVTFLGFYWTTPSHQRRHSSPPNPFMLWWALMTSAVTVFPFLLNGPTTTLFRRPRKWKLIYTFCFTYLSSWSIARSLACNYYNSTSNYLI